MKIRYDILYLRFIAICSVLLYHFNSSIFKGGYLGVDILIILTSILNITSILNKLSISQFKYVCYIVKKSNRLFPSYIVILLVCKKYISDKREISFSLFFILNYYYYKKNVDYFYKFDEPSPILHYWCLSLEYQFYFIIPLILIVNIKNFIAAILVGLSLFHFFKYRKYDISYTYYCFVPRMYQFFSVTFIGNKYYTSSNSHIIVIFTIFHCFLLFICKYEYQYIHLFYTAIVCCILNYRFIDCNRYTKLIYFSNVSYSLYLTHYPIIILNKKSVIEKIILITLFSIILYYVCENNISSLLNRINCYILFIIYFIFISVSSSIINNTSKINEKVKYSPKALWIDFSKYRKPCYANITINTKRKVVLLGDSHIQQWILAVRNYFSDKDFLIYFVYLDGVKLIGLNKIDCIVDKIKYINNVEVILMCNIRYNSEFRNDIKYIANYDKYYTTLQKRILEYHNNIIVINDNPHLINDPFKCLNYNNALKCYCVLNVNCTICDLPLYSNKSIRKCDMNKYLCNNGKCNYTINNRVVYVDRHHLTPYITSYFSKQFIECINYKSKKIKSMKRNSAKCMYFAGN